MNKEQRGDKYDDTSRQLAFTKLYTQMEDNLSILDAVVIRLTAVSDRMLGAQPHSTSPECDVAEGLVGSFGHINSLTSQSLGQVLELTARLEEL